MDAAATRSLVEILAPADLDQASRANVFAPVVAAAAETPMTSPDHGAPQECCITLSCPPGSSLPSTVGGIFDAPVSRLKVK